VKTGAVNARRCLQERSLVVGRGFSKRSVAFGLAVRRAEMVDECKLPKNFPAEKGKFGAELFHEPF